jgi:hypothetical protein
VPDQRPYGRTHGVSKAIPQGCGNQIISGSLSRHHNYVNFLNKINDDRANYLILANSILLAGIINVKANVDILGRALDISIALGGGHYDNA